MTDLYDILVYFNRQHLDLVCRPCLGPLSFCEAVIFCHVFDIDMYVL